MEKNLKGKRGGIVIYDKDDDIIVGKYKWYQNVSGYCFAQVGDKCVKMEKLLLNPEKGMVVDHINNNKLDNRRENLRIVSAKQNAQNLKKQEGCSSQYKGVTKNGSFFYSKITYNSKLKYLGKYETEEEAAEAYDIFILHHDDASCYKLNFPDKKELLKTQPMFMKKIDKTSKFIGVCKSFGKFEAEIKYGNSRVHLIRTDDEEEAANVYDEFIVKNNIPNKILNFPEKYPDYNGLTIKTLFKEINDSTIQLIIKSSPESYVTISKGDYDKVKNYSMYLDKDGYPIVSMGRRNARLSRLIMSETDQNAYIDHIDNNKQNNTRENLRKSNAKLNAQNKKKITGTSSKYINVSYKKNTKMFTINIKINGVTTYISSDINEDNAARKRDIYVMKHLSHTHYPIIFNDWDDETINYWKTYLNFDPDERVVKRRAKTCQ